MGRARGASKQGMSQGREQTRLWSVQPPTLATEQRTHLREPEAHLRVASSLPARGLVNPGNSWTEAEASFISMLAVDSLLGA